jgi:hypothetical protein
MFRICIPQGTHMFFWHILIRLMCFYLHILQHTILSISGPDSQICSHIFFGGIFAKQYFYLPNFFCSGIFAKTVFLFTEFLLQWHCSSHRTCCTVIIIFRLHRINNDLCLPTETVQQNGTITYIDCQYYLPIFIIWSLLKSKVLELRIWVGDPQLWVQNAGNTFRSCKKMSISFHWLSFVRRLVHHKPRDNLMHSSSFIELNINFCFT